MNQISWKKFFNDETKKDYFKKIKLFLEEEYKNKRIYPPKNEIFNAFRFCDFNNIKVIILGQDPYHQYGQANGLAFSVNDGVKIPPSLKNIYKEISLEYSCSMSNTGNLISWAKQGVFLLNATLSVEDSKPNSHSKIGWSIFTDNLIKYLSDNRENLVFILWGNNARSKRKLIDTSKHLILEGVHPSPLSANRGFFYCNHFIKTNDYLKSKNLKEINWKI